MEKEEQKEKMEDSPPPERTTLFHRARSRRIRTATPSGLAPRRAQSAQAERTYKLLHPAPFPRASYALHMAPIPSTARHSRHIAARMLASGAYESEKFRVSSKSSTPLRGAQACEQRCPPPTLLPLPSPLPPALG